MSTKLSKAKESAAGRTPFAPIDIFLRGALVVNALGVFLPIIFMINSSFRNGADIYTSPLALADGIDLSNYRLVLTEGKFTQYLLNSFIVTASATFIVLLFGTLAGYALARYQFKFNTAIYLFFLAGLLIPAKLALVPLFIQLKNMGLLDSRIGLILVYASGAIPAAVFIFTGFIRALPADLDNAARIDGASELQVFGRVMLPLIFPVTGIVGIYSAIPIWNDFLLPLVFIRDTSKMTIMQGISVFFGEYGANWGALFAGLTMAALPLVILYVILSSQFIKGLTAGATKG
ncbi:MAG: carbohydrate ABC transporter permease [Actinomycetota bacterium]|jgi:raffinose/stachyose/melibiose transport system permease protein